MFSVNDRVKFNEEMQFKLRCNFPEEMIVKEVLESSLVVFYFDDKGSYNEFEMDLTYFENLDTFNYTPLDREE